MDLSEHNLDVEFIGSTAIVTHLPTGAVMSADETSDPDTNRKIAINKLRLVHEIVEGAKEIEHQPDSAFDWLFADPLRYDGDE